VRIETKTVGQNTVAEYEKFGWQQSETVHRGRSHYIEYVVARDMDRENYRLLAALEAKYFSLKAQKKTYNPADPLIGVALFFLFVFPLVIYLLVKNSQKEKIESNNNRIQLQMDAVVKEAAELL
jgi:hypothetical protein